MKQKDMYTLNELFDSLDISLAKLGRIANINENTLSRIRDGNPARVETVNKLLNAFSKVYELELSRRNVSGIALEDKKAARQRIREHKRVDERPEKQSVETPVIPTTKAVSERPKKRDYKPRDIALPSGSTLASKFAEDHSVKRPTFIEHMTKGRGPEHECVDYSEREKPNRPTEKEKYLTSDQQKAAFEFWERHNVAFAECNDIGCWCHTVRNGE